MTDSSRRCAHAACTCHTDGDEEYCSESCRLSAERGTATGCGCGHAACVASDFAPAPVIPPKAALSRRT